MSECCTSSRPAQAHPGKYACPVNGKPYTSVSSTTILHHLNQPWNWDKKQQGYYFCEDPDCEVVYFAQDDSVIYKSALRTKVGIKDKSNHALLCYCVTVLLCYCVTVLLCYCVTVLLCYCVTVLV
jgi:hypothetical protein